MRRAEVIDIYQPMTENDLKQAVLLLAYRQGWKVYHVPQATMRNGGGAGYPDLTLARDGEVRWIELKAEKGQARPEAGRVDRHPPAQLRRPSERLVERTSAGVAGLSLETVRRWVDGIGHMNLETGRRITKADVLLVIDELIDADRTVNIHQPLQVDRGKACPLDEKCYRYQGHDGEHMYPTPRP